VQLVQLLLWLASYRLPVVWRATRLVYCCCTPLDSSSTSCSCVHADQVLRTAAAAALAVMSSAPGTKINWTASLLTQTMCDASGLHPPIA
jgi:hypothetical protein